MQNKVFAFSETKIFDVWYAEEEFRMQNTERRIMTYESAALKFWIPKPSVF